MKLAHRLLLPAMALFAINAHGQTEELPSATIDGITYTVTSLEGHTCQLYRCTEEYYSNFSPDLVIPATVEIAGEEYSVTSIYPACLPYLVDDFFKTISVPATLTELSSYTLSNLSALTDIFVAEGNPAMTSVDGVLFNADKTTLIRMPRNYFASHSAPEDRFEIPATVTALDNQAFRSCTGLKYISIPETVTSIGYNCFGNSGLVEIDIPDNVTQISNGSGSFMGTFTNCPNLQRVRIGDGVTYLPEYMFSYCDALKEVVLGKNITSIATQELATIYSLECHATEPPVCDKDMNFDLATYRNILTVPLGCKEAYAAAKGWSNYVNIFEKDCSTAEEAYSATVGDFTYTISSETERTCQLSSCSVSGMTDIVIPSTVNINGATYSVTSISYSWLSKMQRETIQSINIPATVTDVHYTAFLSFPALTDIIVAEGNPALASVDGVLLNADKTTLIRMPINYFANRSALEGRYETPSTVTKLEDQAFYCCKGLEYITLPEALTSIGLNGFGNTGLTEIDIPDNVTEMKSHSLKYFGTFCSCSNLRLAYIGNGVPTVPNGIFYGCTAPMSIHFGDKITAVTTDMLGHTDTKVFNLTDLTLGKGTTSVASLEAIRISRNITCRATVPPVCEADENFSSSTYSRANLIVPYGCKEAYAAAKGWSGFAKITESEVISGIDAATDGMAPAADVRYENGTLTCDAWDNGTRVTVYAANGSTVLSATANDGKVAFPAVAGFYIVAANGSTSKVFVR